MIVYLTVLTCSVIPTIQFSGLLLRSLLLSLGGSERSDGIQLPCYRRNPAAHDGSSDSQKISFNRLRFRFVIKGVSALGIGVALFVRRLNPKLPTGRMTRTVISGGFLVMAFGFSLKVLAQKFPETLFVHFNGEVSTWFYLAWPAIVWALIWGDVHKGTPAVIHTVCQFHHSAASLCFLCALAALRENQTTHGTRPRNFTSASKRIHSGEVVLLKPWMFREDFLFTHSKRQPT